MRACMALNWPSIYSCTNISFLIQLWALCTVHRRLAENICKQNGAPRYLLGFLRRTLYMTYMWPSALSIWVNYVIDIPHLLFHSWLTVSTRRDAQIDRLLTDILLILQFHHTDISSLIMSIVTGVNEFVTSLRLDNLLVAFTQYPRVRTWINDHEHEIYIRKLQALTSTETFWTLLRMPERGRTCEAKSRA